MKIAVPVSDGKLSDHFGHCDHFAVYCVDLDAMTAQEKSKQTPPPHAPGVIPKWLADLGISVVIAGGIGRRAQQMFEQCGILLISGAEKADPDHLVSSYLSGYLAVGENTCDH